MKLGLVDLAVSALAGCIPAVSSLVYIAYKFGIYTNKISNIEKTTECIPNMRERLARVEEGKANISDYIQSKSPLSLTDKGKLVLYESDGHNFIEKNKQALLDEIKSKIPKTAYDVQTYSEEVIKEKSNQESFNSIKNYAFKEGIELGIIIKIMGIYLRDFALSDNGFAINEL
jgi:hypothetical protein